MIIYQVTYHGIVWDWQGEEGEKDLVTYFSTPTALGEFVNEHPDSRIKVIEAP